MIRMEAVVDTKEELDKALEYYKSTICRLKIASLDIFCVEESKTYFLIQRPIEEGRYVFMEDRSNI